MDPVRASRVWILMRSLVGVVLVFALGLATAAGSPYDQAISQVMRKQKLKNANVPIEDIGESALPTLLRGKDPDAADRRRVVFLGSYVEGREQGTFFAAVAIDRNGSYVLLRPRPHVLQAVMVPRGDCSGVKGIRLQRLQRVALLPKGSAIGTTVDVPFDYVQMLELHPAMCNTIP